MRGKILFLLVLIPAIIIGGCAQKQPPAPVSETRLLLDTVCSVTVYGARDQALTGQAMDLCVEYEALFSITLEGSDVWRVNAAGGAPVFVAPETIEVVKTGLVYGELSGGSFDITIGRLSRLWDFPNRASVPTEREIVAALETVDYRQVTLDGNTIKLANTGAWIDLGGIAKGYIADKVADYLRSQGVTGAVVDFGGDVVTVGQKPDGSPWMIGVRQPFGDRNQLLGVVATGEAAVVTSGIYERQFEQDGVLYHHILDPTTGKPVRSDVVSVTVVAQSAMAGDAFSTVILLVGSKRAAELVTITPEFIGALLVLDSGELLQLGQIDFKEVG